MRYSFYTLGCKANQFDTQAMEQLVNARGHSVCSFDDDWDVCILNTCSVTSTSDKKSRQAIRQAQRKNPNGIIAVCGCYAQMSHKEVEALGVNVVGGAVGKEDFLDSIESFFDSRKPSVNHTVLSRGIPFEILEPGCLSGRTRALMKVQDGCDNYCTYCIIPYSRGHIRSMPIDTAVEQIKKLKKDGYKEVIITGIEISSYGRDLINTPSLIDLLERISYEADDMRIRLGSLEPRTVTNEFCNRLAPLKNICRHFHLSLQSGCDETLARMKRKYNTARYFESVTLLREFFPNCSITTDLIVGFPEETQEEFDSTLSFIRKCSFSAMHIFPYSIRKNTPAARMQQLTRTIKESRAKIASTIAAKMHTEYLDSQLGTIVSVLFETSKDGYWHGHTDTYIEVIVKTDLPLQNELRNVRINSVLSGQLVGEIEE